MSDKTVSSPPEADRNALERVSADPDLALLPRAENEDAKRGPAKSAMQVTELSGTPRIRLRLAASTQRDADALAWCLRHGGRQDLVSAYPHMPLAAGERDLLRGARGRVGGEQLPRVALDDDQALAVDALHDAHDVQDQLAEHQQRRDGPGREQAQKQRRREQPARPAIPELAQRDPP